MAISGAGCQITPGGGQTTLEQRLAVWSAFGGGQTARAYLSCPKQHRQRDFLQGISMIHLFMDKGEELLCSLGILTRIKNLSKVATID
jgi:hypothetical protein